MRIILFLILLCSAMTSCRNKTPNKAETNSAETKNSHQTNVFVAHEEAFAAMKPDVADSATCQRYSHDTIIMPYRFKYCVVNDDSDILKYIKYPDTDNQERDTVVYKGRKLCIMISDGKQIFNKPKSVIRISRCCMAERNPLVFPISRGRIVVFSTTWPSTECACSLSFPDMRVLISVRSGLS
ncbi:hypothetical protein SAMN05216518_13243 [Bacteroidales bacterium KHT7]|nr:hypothetical protein SAMN05216518_13243 [Bacteroidales bacterium KHT7]